MKVKVTTMRTIFVDVDSPELEKECAMMESEEFRKQGYIEIPDEIHNKAVSASGFRCHQQRLLRLGNHRNRCKYQVYVVPAQPAGGRLLY